MSLKDRITQLLSERVGLSDRDITDILLGSLAGQQAVNQACRLLEVEGILTREKIPGGRIGNYLREGHDPSPSPPKPPQATASDDLSEDQVKAFLEQWLLSSGWTPAVAWGHAFGIDIEAHRGGARWMIEVKGCGSRQPMRVNYFLAMLGELLQRMNDPRAKYSIAVPDMPQYRALWSRLPLLAKEHTGITA